LALHPTRPALLEPHLIDVHLLAQCRQRHLHVLQEDLVLGFSREQLLLHQVHALDQLTVRGQVQLLHEQVRAGLWQGTGWGKLRS